MSCHAESSITSLKRSGALAMNIHKSDKVGARLAEVLQPGHDYLSARQQIARKTPAD